MGTQQIESKKNNQLFLKSLEKNVREKEAWQYDASISQIRKIVEPLAIFRHFQPDAKDSVLDIGAGTGRFMAELVKSGCSVVGVDFSRSSLMVAKKRCNCEAVVADLCYLPFKTHSFDKSISVSVLQHVPPSAYTLGLNEITRVNKKGAKILFTVYNHSLWHFLTRQTKDGYHPGGNNFHRFNFTEVRTLLKSSFFQVDSINGIVASDSILRTHALRKLNLSRKHFSPMFLKAIIAAEQIIERIIPLSFMLGDHLRVICRNPRDFV